MEWDDLEPGEDDLEHIEGRFNPELTVEVEVAGPFIEDTLDGGAMVRFMERVKGSRVWNFEAVKMSRTDLIAADLGCDCPCCTGDDDG